MIEIEYKTNKIQCIVEKSKIKNLYIYIKNGKVLVKAPFKLKDKEIEQFLNKKSKWIYENLHRNKKKIEQEQNIKITEKELEKLKQIVEKNIIKYSKALGKAPNNVRIKKLKYAWGSCSSNKNISINSKLAVKDENAIKYVVLHEMCHLIYMNHSKNFWNLVEKHMPNYKEYKKLLA